MPHIYGLSDAQARLVAGVSQLAQKVLARHAADVDAKARFPEESLAALARERLLGLCVPAQWGGLGEGPRAFVAVTEELARGCASTAMIYVMHVTAAQAIQSSSGLAHKEALLRAIAEGKHLSTLALSERGSRSQFWAPVSKMTARDGGWGTSAQKSWVTSAHRADSLVASAQKPDAASPLESTIYLLRKPSDCARITASWDGLGLRGNDSAPITIEDLKVSGGDLISEQGAGARTMLEVILPWFAVGTSAMANGLCRTAVEMTAQHLSSTSFEHTGSSLRDLPTLRARLAEMSMRTEQARALLSYTVGELERPSDTTPLYVLQTRMASLQAALDVTDLGMKACGGAAFSRHLGLERVFRDARAGWVMAPTVDHLADFVGRALTGLPLF